jgi:rhodanese-related sulfurtransferase
MSVAIEEQHVRQKAHTVYGLYLTPFEAWNMKHQQGDEVLLVDIRSRAELKYVGSSPLIDANIPSRFLNPDYRFSSRANTYRTVLNDHVVEDFEKLLSSKDLNKDAALILMCRSGSSVPKLAKRLKEAGFETVYSQYQGFEGIKAKSGINKGVREIYGWKNSGLPWSYKLKEDALYFNFDASRKQDSD